MTTKTEKTDLDVAQELYDFLQGTIPDDIHLGKGRVPKLTPKQAWTVVWYLGNQYRAISDNIEKCDVCGTLYDSCSEGDCLDYGNGPYHFCDYCIYSEKYERKAKDRK